MAGDRGYAHAAMTSFTVPQPLAAVREPMRSGLEFVQVIALAAWGEQRTPRTQLQSLVILQAIWKSTVIEWLNGEICRDAAEKRLRLSASLVVPDTRGRRRVGSLTSVPTAPVDSGEVRP